MCVEFVLECTATIKILDKCIATGWTPKLEINTNTKITKVPRTTGLPDGRTYYTTTKVI